jgi:hypothetical protein
VHWRTAPAVFAGRQRQLPPDLLSGNPEPQHLQPPTGRRAGDQLQREILILWHQLQLQAAQQTHRHQTNFELRQRLAQADPLTAAEGQQGEARVARQVALGAEGRQVIGG